MSVLPTIFHDKKCWRTNDSFSARKVSHFLKEEICAFKHSAGNLSRFAQRYRYFRKKNQIYSVFSGEKMS